MITVFLIDEKPIEVIAELTADHDEILPLVMSEQFVYSQHPEDVSGGWNLCALTELLMKALLGQGAKTLTHSARVFENYQRLLIWLTYVNLIYLLNTSIQFTSFVLFLNRVYLLSLSNFSLIHPFIV